MGEKADLQNELDELGVEYKPTDTIKVLKAKIAKATAPPPPGLAEDPEENARVEQKCVTVKAPPSWANSNWHAPFLGSTALRFNRVATAQLCVEQAGEPIMFEFMGPNGLVQVPVADKVAEHPDLYVEA